MQSDDRSLDNCKKNDSSEIIQTFECIKNESMIYVLNGDHLNGVCCVRMIKTKKQKKKAKKCENIHTYTTEEHDQTKIIM